MNLLKSNTEKIIETDPTKMRRIALDTETTGLSFKEGDRVIEIGAVEMIGNMETENRFHVYINPSPRKVHPDALRVHGITDDMLRDKPKFRTIYRDFLAFIGDSPIVIHNASFDMGFLNEEFARMGMPAIKNEIIDSLRIAREKHPGAKASLDALCVRYGVDNSNRELHGALIDATLLARVYIKLMDFDKLDFTNKDSEETDIPGFASIMNHNRIFRPSRGVIIPTSEEKMAHDKFIGKITDSVWEKFN